MISGANFVDMQAAVGEVAKLVTCRPADCQSEHSEDTDKDFLNVAWPIHRCNLHWNVSILWCSIQHKAMSRHSRVAWSKQDPML